MHSQVESLLHRFQLETAVGMSAVKAILHGTFLHLFHQRAAATGFPCIHAGPDQRFDFAHGFLQADPTKDERRKNAGFL